MFLRWISFVAVLIAISGCGSEPAYKGPQRFALSGKVTLDGAPVDGGTISFLSMAPKANPSGGPISAGTYTVPEERGANAEMYRVEIRWLKPTGEKVKDDDTGGMIDVVKEVIPAKFNTQTELKADVKADKTTFNFDLSSK